MWLSADISFSCMDAPRLPQGWRSSEEATDGPGFAMLRTKRGQASPPGVGWEAAPQRPLERRRASLQTLVAGTRHNREHPAGGAAHAEYDDAPGR